MHYNTIIITFNFADNSMALQTMCSDSEVEEAKSSVEIRGYIIISAPWLVMHHVDNIEDVLCTHK